MLDKMVKASVAVWMVAQLVCIVVFWGEPQYSDANTYQTFAYDCYSKGMWYPMEEHLYEAFIFNPGYVNFLVLQLHIFGTFLYNGIIGLVLNIILLLAVRTIVGSLVGERARQWATIFFCLLSSNWFFVVLTLTDLLYATLLFLSLALIQKRCGLLLLSALLMCYANYTRPLFVVFVIPILLYMLYRRFGWGRIATYLGSYAVFTALLTLAVLNNTAARGTAGGTTLGFNLAMGANDKMNGTMNHAVFEEGNYGYVEGPMTVYDRDAFWRAGAIEWIKGHCPKYLLYAPVKLFRLWWGDYYPYGPLYGEQMMNEHTTKADAIWRAVRVVAFSLVYYVVMVLFALALWKLRRRLLGYWGIFLIPVVLGSAMHMVLYGAPRYHYPYMPIVIMYASMAALMLEKKTHLIKNLE